MRGRRIGALVITVAIGAFALGCAKKGAVPVPESRPQQTTTDQQGRRVPIDRETQSAQEIIRLRIKTTKDRAEKDAAAIARKRFKQLKKKQPNIGSDELLQELLTRLRKADFLEALSLYEQIYSQIKGTPGEAEMRAALTETARVYAKVADSQQNLFEWSREKWEKPKVKALGLTPKDFWGGTTGIIARVDNKLLGKTADFYCFSITIRDQQGKLHSISVLSAEEIVWLRKMFEASGRSNSRRRWIRMHVARIILTLLK